MVVLRWKRFDAPCLNNAGLLTAGVKAADGSGGEVGGEEGKG